VLKVDNFLACLKIMFEYDTLRKETFDISIG